MIIVSACLAGCRCRYDGGQKTDPRIERLVARGLRFPSAEQLGGLATPRSPCEIQNGAGADALLGQASVFQGRRGRYGKLLKGRPRNSTHLQDDRRESGGAQTQSPSCGCGLIYDGTFSGKKRRGRVTAALLRKNGIQVLSEENTMKDNNTILMIDDDKNICRIVTLYLEKEGFKVEAVNNGTEGLKRFRELPPAMVLLDVMLPGMDGWQICREIREESEVPIIMLTAKGEVFDKILGLELGADDYLAKPFDTKELVAASKP